MCSCVCMNIKSLGEILGQYLPQERCISEVQSCYTITCGISSLCIQTHSTTLGDIMLNFCPLSRVWYCSHRMCRSSSPAQTFISSWQCLACVMMKAHSLPPLGQQPTRREILWEWVEQSSGFYKSIPAITPQPWVCVEIRCFVRDKEHHWGVPRRLDKEANQDWQNVGTGTKILSP